MPLMFVALKVDWQTGSYNSSHIVYKKVNKVKASSGIVHKVVSYSWRWSLAVTFNIKTFQIELRL